VLPGVSAGTQWLLLANALCWGGYALLTGSLWADAPGLVNAPLAVLTIVVLRRAKPSGSRSGRASAGQLPSPRLPRPGRIRHEAARVRVCPG